MPHGKRKSFPCPKRSPTYSKIAAWCSPASRRSAALLGLLAALTGIYLASWTGNPVYDGAASVVIGLLLGGTAIFIAQETKGLLVGEAASREVVQTLNEIVARVEHVEHVN